MNNLDVKEIILLLIIIVLGIFISLNLFKNNKVTFITDSDYLYDSAVEYLIKNDNNPYVKKKNYKKFVDYKGFGIAQDKKYKYAYMWIVTESYYEQDGKLISEFGSSLPYKFIFDKKTDKIIKAITANDGKLFKVSIKNMYPKSIQNKVLNYTVDYSNLQKKVDNYYKDKINVN